MPAPLGGIANGDSGCGVPRVGVNGDGATGKENGDGGKFPFAESAATGLAGCGVDGGAAGVAVSVIFY